MKFAKAIAILIGGPSIALMVALIIGGFGLRSDPNFLANGGHAAPGDGFLFILLAIGALAISIPVSLIVAIRVVCRKPTDLTSPTVINVERS